MQSVCGEGQISRAVDRDRAEQRKTLRARNVIRSVKNAELRGCVASVVIKRGMDRRRTGYLVKPICKTLELSCLI